MVALLPDTLVGPAALLPADLMPDGPRRYVVRADDPAAVAGGLAGLGQVLTTAQWIDAYNDQQQQVSTNIMLALLGMAMVYTVIAMVNAVVIAASDRRSEFAAARVTGLTRGQVVFAALAESLAVVAIGVLLGVGRGRRHDRRHVVGGPRHGRDRRRQPAVGDVRRGGSAGRRGSGRWPAC